MPEAIIPLDQIPDQIPDVVGDVVRPMTVHINIQRVDARDSRDVDDLIYRIRTELGSLLASGSRLGVGVGI